MRYDVIIIGGGHNGLVSAFYLARAGLKVALLEKRELFGGPCATVDALPGYRVSFTNSPGSLEPRIVEEMGLESHGLRFLRPDPSMVHLLDNDRAFVAYRDRQIVREQMMRFDAREPDAYAALMAYIENFAARLGVSLYGPPPRIRELVSGIVTPADEAGFGRFFFGSVADLLDRFLYSDEMKAVVGTLANMSTMAGPRSPGTAQMLLWRPLSKLLGQSGGAHDPRVSELRGSTGLPIGGMGAVTDAMAMAARAAGAELMSGIEVSMILTDRDGRAIGVADDTGREYASSVVLSNLPPRRTLLDLANPDGLDPELRADLQKDVIKGNQFKLAIAVEGMPMLRAAKHLDDPGAASRCQFRVAPSLDYLEKAWDDAKYGNWSSGPVYWGLVQSATDPTLAPPGHNVMSVNIYHAPSELNGGRSWEQERDRFAQHCIEVLSEYYEDLESRIVGYRAWSPTDIEAEFGMPGANITYGDVTPARTFSLRPSPYLSHYRTPTPGLYLGGSAMHPAGYVTGIPGHNAATEILADLEAAQGADSAEPLEP